MAFIGLSDILVLGVQEFDEHHRHLIGLINRLYENIVAGTDKEGFENLLDELIDYATYHFAAEENWMKMHRYPDTQRHVEEHDNFSKRIVDMQKRFYFSDKIFSLEVLVFLKEWLTRHILTVDSEYSHFMATAGASG